MKNAQISVKVATITGAAKNDVFLGVNEDGRFTLDVLANDPGAAVLYSVYQAPSQLPGTTAFEVVAPSATLASGSIDIVDGIVVYTANGSQQSLAQGESAGESFIYTVRMANGALSTATATFMVNGVNDIAVISGDAAGAVSEDDTPAGNLTDSGSLTFTDVDLTDVHLVSATGTPVGTTLGSLTAVKDSDTTHSEVAVMGLHPGIAAAPLAAATLIRQPDLSGQRPASHVKDAVPSRLPLAWAPGRLRRRIRRALGRQR